ncbi:STE20/SPS1-related proline-alanine-rich protein kinase [Lamellibrachia satsuma]|nr:STE20/SPS1-related proline-alanine-rich protein kinase [Lamellibrachia satsuma]
MSEPPFRLACQVLMLTLQNEPPALESGTDDKEQYKTYSKTFRRLIAECLRKEPEKRPTAKQLLKHEFFKKCKDRAYLVKTLLSDGPPVKPQKVKRVPGSSGRIHKTADGQWEWSDEELDEESDEGKAVFIDERSPRLIEPPEGVTNQEKPGTNHLAVNRAPSAGGDEPIEIMQKQEAPLINLVLRLRNEKRELNDIKFDFTPGVDTADSVSRELVEASLIDGRDMIVVAANLQKILDCKEHKTITFALNSGCSQRELPDGKGLIGFAQLSINDGTAPDIPLPQQMEQGIA